MIKKRYYEITPPCTKCNRRFIVRDEDERTTVTSFKLLNGKKVYLCRECMTKVAEAKTQTEVDKFIKELEGKIGG